MDQKSATPSFLPYLESNDSKIRINIIDPFWDGTESTLKKNPFRVLNESSPLTRLIRADILTDADSLVQPVFLLVQKDAYRYQPSELWPLTNLDIETSWQEAHAFFSDAEIAKRPMEAVGLPAIRLGTGANSAVGQEAFQSLFFCTYRRVFFHPPCPVCGENLLLCKDDSLLLSQGLDAYSSSLRRYLYCPSCPPGNGGSGFFTPTKDSADSSGVQDCIGLISTWRYLLAGGIASEGFPCINCPFREKCHGADNLSAVRITPFSFFPFHMLVLKALTIPANDFLPLVSGASFADIEGRLFGEKDATRLSAIKEFKNMVGNADLFLFEGTENHFLEVLYLKLSLLKEITEILQAGPAPLDILTALDCLWVKIPKQCSLLPRFWSFNIGYMDIGLAAAASVGRPGSHPILINYFIGAIWFYFLLSNSSLPASALMVALSGILEKRDQTGINFENNPLFALENIFWTPESHQRKGYPLEWQDLWEKTIGLAWALLTADGTGVAGFWDQFREDLSAIRKEIKKQLFYNKGTPVTEAETAADDPAIYKILNGILHKWEATAISAAAGVSGLTKIQEETILLSGNKVGETIFDAESTIQTGGEAQETAQQSETIIFTKNAVAEETIFDAESTIQTGGEAQETVQQSETIIFTKDAVEEDLQETMRIPQANITAELRKTVAIPKGGVAVEHIETRQGPRDKTEDALCETIVLSGKVTGNVSVPRVPESKVENHRSADEDEILSETVILRPPQK